MTSYDDPTLRRLGRALPNPGPTPEQRQALMAAASQVAQRPARDLRPVLAAAATLLLALGAGAWWQSLPAAPGPTIAETEPARVEAEPAIAEAPPAPPARRRVASVLSSGGATFAHEVYAESALEQVRLEDGAIELDVSTLEGRRFELVAGDAQVRVQAARFEARALEGELCDLRVLAGRVELTRPGLAPVVLEVDEAWSREVNVESPPKPARAATRAPPPKPEPPAGEAVVEPIVEQVAAPQTDAAEAPPTGAQAERSFREGWQALAREDFEAAADALEVASRPESPVVEEALYWRAVALIRADRSAEAETALLRYVRVFAGSPRRAEVGLMLGQLNMKRGAYTEAKRWLSVAAQADDRRIRERARQLRERANALELDLH